MKAKFLVLIILFFAVLNFAIPFGSATVPHGGGGGGGGSGQSGIPYPSPPSFNFTPIPVPGFPQINWSWTNWSYDFNQIVDAITGFVGGYIASIIANGFLYIAEAIYYFMAYVEYYIIIGALNASVGLGVYALPAFIGILTLLVFIVLMVIKVGEDVFLVGGA